MERFGELGEVKHDVCSGHRRDLQSRGRCRAHRTPHEPGPRTGVIWLALG